MARDFGEAYPHVILKMKEPVEVTFMLGIKKRYHQVAIKVDQSQEFKQMLQQRLSKHFA